MRITLGIFFLVAILWTSFARADDNEKSRLEVLRYIVKQAVQEDFDSMVALAKKNTKDSGKAFSAELLNALKYLGYQKAYIYYVCTKETIGQLPSNADIEEVLKSGELRSSCVDRRLAEAAKTPKLYEYPHARLRASSCEMKWRLYDAEREFPPYDFLQTKDSRLIDHQNYNSCLMEGLN